MRSRQIKSSASRTHAALAILAVLAATGCDSAPTSPRPLDTEGVGASLQMEGNTGVPQQVNLTFQKTAVAEGVWEGRVAGDIAGELRTELQGLRISGPIWHVDFQWIIVADDPAYSLVFEASGTLNTRTGRVVMNGVVVDGYLEGARVHEEGQAQDPAGAEFVGTIDIMRRSS